MREQTDRAKLERFMRALGERVRSKGTIYVAGGATAILLGWRDTTIDVRSFRATVTSFTKTAKSASR